MHLQIIDLNARARAISSSKWCYSIFKATIYLHDINIILARKLRKTETHSLDRTKRNMKERQPSLDQTRRHNLVISSPIVANALQNYSTVACNSFH